VEVGAKEGGLSTLEMVSERGRVESLEAKQEVMLMVLEEGMAARQEEVEKEAEESAEALVSETVDGNWMSMYPPASMGLLRVRVKT
jgi:hypothetical protein